MAHDRRGMLDDVLDDVEVQKIQARGKPVTSQ